MAKQSSSVTWKTTFLGSLSIRWVSKTPFYWSSQDKRWVFCFLTKFLLGSTEFQKISLLSKIFPMKALHSVPNCHVESSLYNISFDCAESQPLNVNICFVFFVFFFLFFFSRFFSKFKIAKCKVLQKENPFSFIYSFIYLEELKKFEKWNTKCSELRNGNEE